MKKTLALFLAMCLCLGLSVATASTTPTLSYAAQELRLPAAGLMIYVPANMDRTEGDEEAYDLGFRFNCYTDTFDFTLWVHDSRDMSLEDYAAFYAERYGYTATAETINGFVAQSLISNDVAGDYVALVALPDSDTPAVIYALSFACTNDDDVTLANEIMSTLATY
jgi:hypothetical protein